jgi:hypothetical protein
VREDNQDTFEVIVSLEKPVYALCNDDQILHAAIRILRRDIEKISISTDEYPTANEVSLALSMDRMPL